MTLLLPHHLAGLRARGLTDATITAAGLHSETDSHKLGVLLGWKYAAKKLGAAIVIPFTDAAGKNGYHRLRPDNPRKDRNGKPVKYESPKGQPNQIYIPPGDAKYFADPRQEIALTEGEFKALSLSQEILPAIGLVGVMGWKPKDHAKLLPALEAIVWTGRNVYLLPDSDFASNENVRNAFCWLGKHLTDRGAKVRLVSLPDGPPDAEGKPTKLGIDDWLALQTDRKAALRKLLDGAEPPPPVDAELVKHNAETADPAKEAAAFLKETEKDGVFRLRSYRGEVIYWEAGKFSTVPQSDAEAQVFTELNRHLQYVKRSHVGNVLAQIKAQSIIYSRVTPPAWIGKGERKWNPEETIVAKNGIVSLPAYVSGDDYLSPATPQYFTFSALDYDFNPKAAKPERWLKFLAEVMPDDAESIDCLQEWAGLLLVNWTDLQKILAIIGQRRCGKGTIARVLRSVIGESNVASPTLSSLSADYGLWALLDKTAAFITDARLSNKTDSAIVVERLLNISGEDAVDVPRKYLETLRSVKLPVRIVLFSNELPALTDSSGALSGRLIVLRLTQTFYGRENRRLTAELLEEREGILLWAVEGWHRLRERGYFIQPESGRELAEQMDEISSPVAMFVREFCVVDPAVCVSVSDLYNGWCWWCRQKGRKETGTEQIFGRNLSAAVASVRRSQPRADGGRLRMYEGIDLTPSVKREIDDKGVGGEF